MAGPIGRLPRGLSSLLQLKGGLTNPTELLDAVIPVLELLDFYQLDKREREVSSKVTAPALLFPSSVVDFSVGDFEVPDDEVHIIWHYHLEGLLPATYTSLQIAPVIEPAGSPSKTILADHSEVFAGDDFLFCALRDVPFFALAGTGFSFVVLRAVVAGANITISAKKEFTRLKI